jgi:hypothetical protein
MLAGLHLEGWLSDQVAAAADGGEQQRDSNELGFVHHRPLFSGIFVPASTSGRS